MKITFGRFFRNTPATIMRCVRTFRLASTHPARARSSGSETLSRSRSLVGYTIDTHESEVFGSHSDEVGRVKHQHAHAITGTNTRLAQAGGELADAHRQRAVAQRFLCAQDRGMLRPGELQTVQQA